MGIQYVTAPNVTNFLWIDQDLIFLNAAGDVRGATAIVDTDGSFHDYRIEVLGTTAGSVVNVYYDGAAVPVLAGSLFSSTATTTEISWGVLSPSVSGTSEWRFVGHNAAVPEPSTLLLVGSGLLFLRRGLTTRCS